MIVTEPQHGSDSIEVMERARARSSSRYARFEPLVEVTAVPGGVVVRAPRILDARVADRLAAVANDVRRADHRRAVTHLDLRAVAWCSRTALEVIGSLLESGARLVVEPLRIDGVPASLVSDLRRQWA